MAPGEHEGLEAKRDESDETAEKHGGPPGHEEARERADQPHDDEPKAVEAKKAEKKEERAERRDDNKADKKQDKQGKKDKDDKKK